MSFTLAYFRTLCAEKLDEERYRHTLGVEAWALELATKYGINADSVSLAALTHDLGKQFSITEQVEKAKAWHLILSPEDLEIPEVLHGRLAAYMLEKEYHIKDPEVLQAVYNHTLGRPGMCPLEMLIYSADLTEAGRNFPGVDKLRQKLYHDLIGGTLACIEHTLQYLKQKNKAVHPLTILTYQDLKDKNVTR